MNLSYNRIAGQSVERLAALSDGIFSVGMTLLVLDLRVPAREVIHASADLSTRLLGDFPGYRLALIVYWLNLLFLGVTNYLCWICATHLKLTKDDMPSDVSRAIRTRVIGYQALYAVGALLCVVGTQWSIAFIVLVQLTAVIALRR